MRATASALLLSLLYTAPAAAQVSATASPVSNSSGSVVNQAVQITPGQYMKHSYGSQIQCDSATLNISPLRLRRILLAIQTISIIKSLFTTTATTLA